jgi:hypothetical protein
MASFDIGKAKKILGSTFVKENENLSEDEAAFMIVRSEQVIKDLDEEMANHEELQAAMQVVKDLKAGYINSINFERAKIRYLLERIQEIRDGSPSSDL